MDEIRSFLIKFWKKTLKIRKIDTTVPLFELGADSINISKCVREINDQYSLDMELPIIFEYDTIDLLAEYILKMI